jgi:hypothetical protein
MTGPKGKTDPIETSLDLVAQVAKFNATHDIHYQIAKHRGIKAWALRRLGVDYAIGDRVYLESDHFTNPDDARHSYRECAQQGATARVVEIDYNLPHDYWYAGIVLDREWSIIGGLRHWHGPIRETPDGMIPPEEESDGARHVFLVHAQQIAKVHE